MWASCDTLDSICIVCKHLRLDRQEWWAHCVCQISDVMRRGTHIMWGLIGRAYMGWYPQEESKHNPPEGLIGVKNTLILWQLVLPKNLVSICDRGSVSWLYFAPLDAHRVQYIINHLWDHVLSRSQLRKKKKKLEETTSLSHWPLCTLPRLLLCPGRADKLQKVRGVPPLNRLQKDQNLRYYLKLISLFFSRKYSPTSLCFF